MVVISCGLGREEIERSLHAFNALANPAPAPTAAKRGGHGGGAFTGVEHGTTHPTLAG